MSRSVRDRLLTATVKSCFVLQCLIAVLRLPCVLLFHPACLSHATSQSWHVPDTPVCGMHAPAWPGETGMSTVNWLLPRVCLRQNCMEARKIKLTSDWALNLNEYRALNWQHIERAECETGRWVGRQQVVAVCWSFVDITTTSVDGSCVFTDLDC